MLNLLALEALPQGTEEIFQTLLESAQNHRVHLERIVSAGQITPPGEYYDQAWDEWVLLMQGEAELAYDDGSASRLRAGDSLLIPAHRRHRVDFTSEHPPCLWLALHLKPAEPEPSRP